MIQNAQTLSSGDRPTDGQEPLRERIAQVILSNRAAVERRIRGKLRRARVSADHEDIFSSVLRRVDAACVKGVLRTNCEAELWAYIMAIADNGTLNTLRSASAHLPKRLSSDNTLPAEAAAARRSCESDDAAVEVAKIFHSLARPSDRELLRRQLEGVSYRDIAATSGESVAAVRQRWMRLRRRIRAVFKAQGCSETRRDEGNGG